MEVQIPNGIFISIVISNNALFVFTGEMWSSAVLSSLHIRFPSRRVSCALQPLISMEWNKIAQELLQSD